MSLGYSIQDYNMKYGNTYVSVVQQGVNRAFRVAQVEGTRENPVLAGFFVNDNGSLDLEVSRVSVNNPSVSLDPPKVGMVNYDGRLMYVERCPRRRYKQGFDLDNYNVVKYVTHRGDPSFPNLTHVFNPKNVPLEVAIASTLNTQYGARLNRFTGLVGTGTDQIVVVHRRGTIGKVRDNKLYLLDTVKDMVDSMKRLGFRDIELVKSEVKDDLEELQAAFFDQCCKLLQETYGATDVFASMEEIAAAVNAMQNTVNTLDTDINLLVKTIVSLLMFTPFNALQRDYLVHIEDSILRRVIKRFENLTSKVEPPLVQEGDDYILKFDRIPGRIANDVQVSTSVLRSIAHIGTVLNYVMYYRGVRDLYNYRLSLRDATRGRFDADFIHNYLTVTEAQHVGLVGILHQYGDPYRAARRQGANKKLNEFEKLLISAQNNVGKVPDANPETNLRANIVNDPTLRQVRDAQDMMRNIRPVEMFIDDEVLEEEEDND